MPILTSANAARFCHERTCSFKNIAENTTPNTGIEKLYTAILPTGLYLISSAHILKATVESNAIYKRSADDCTVNPCTLPPASIPVITRTAPPNKSWYA